MSSRSPEWVWQLHHKVSRYAIPFTWGPPIRRGEPIEIHGGSCAVVDFGETPFLITAAHVVDAALSAVATPNIAYIIGRDTELLLTPSVIHTDPDRDLATIQLTSQQLRRLEAEASIVRPDGWPPPELHIDDPILFVGYPGALRVQVGDNTVDFRAESRLAFIYAFQDHRFVCMLDPAYRNSRQVGVEELPATDMPGLSGGPAFLVRHEQILVPRLCGIIVQGSILADAVFAVITPLDTVERDGSLRIER